MELLNVTTKGLNYKSCLWSNKEYETKGKVNRLKRKIWEALHCTVESTVL